MDQPPGKSSAQLEPDQPHDESALIAARREKLRRWREEFGIEPYGRRVDGLVSLAEARAMFSRDAHDAFKSTTDAAKREQTHRIVDQRKRARVAGRCVQHRLMGKLLFIVLRDYSGDLQISVSKAAVDHIAFAIASKLDYGDIVVTEGPIGMTNTGEICIWAASVELHCKSLVPPPEKFHGLTDPELRYRRRYVDMYANPETIRTFHRRSAIVSRIRQFMEKWEYVEVETPMMQPLAGGAAARPFVTHHNALDIDLFLRVAPELYLKRLLVGGMPRVYEINRNFRNEGVDRLHNPEFTSLEAYEAFGNCETMLELTEGLINELACFVSNEDRPILPFGDLEIDYSTPFDRIRYETLFEQTLGFPMTEFGRVRAQAGRLDIETAEQLDDWLIVNEVYERVCERAINPARPTFVTDYPSKVSPLTRPHIDRPELCERWELLIGGMEIGTAYTELNDPEVQLARFSEQLRGADEETRIFRNLDEDFLYALQVGMPPAGGLGLGIDRLVMLLTDQPNIRDVILFPLMRPVGPPGRATDSSV